MEIHALRRLLLVALLALGGCQRGGSDDASANASPDGAVRAAVAGLRSADLKGLVLAQVPPADLARLRTEWRADLTRKPVTEKDRREFAQTMAELTAPDAEQALFRKLEPQLAKMESELNAQLPIWVGMGRGIASASLKANKDLNEQQKAEALKTVESVAHWAEQLKLADREAAKRAIAAICQAARSLKLNSLDDLRSLDFDQALAKGGIALQGGKQLLANYGLSLDAVLDTVQVETLAQEGDQARVRVAYRLFDVPVSYEAEMTRIDGRWYGKELVQQLRKPKSVSEVGPGPELSDGSEDEVPDEVRADADQADQHNKGG